MNGFGGIGGWELLLIAVIAILVLGPERMIHYAFRMGRFVKKMSAYWQEGADSFRAEVNNIEEAADSNISDIQDIGGTKDIAAEFKTYVNSVDSITTSMSGTPTDTLNTESLNNPTEEEHMHTNKQSSKEADLYGAWRVNNTLDR
jgi:Sec-independent protein translocase protein TatA